MPCMCGDLCCPSCGPAQGNWRCPICNEWASEECEHINNKGELKPTYRIRCLHKLIPIIHSYYRYRCFKCNKYLRIASGIILDEEAQKKLTQKQGEF